jgi:hypothetical protein
MTADHRRWAPTPLGRRFLSDLQASFLPDTPQPHLSGA